MPPIITRLGALLILCLALDVTAQTNACPAGEKQVCLDGCICLPDVVPDGIYQIAAPALALWLTQARAEAANAGTQAIPPRIREQLLHWYEPGVLDTARYRISDNGQFNAATAMLQNPDVGAVTLIDIIPVPGRSIRRTGHRALGSRTQTCAAVSGLGGVGICPAVYAGFQCGRGAGLCHTG